MKTTTSALERMPEEEFYPVSFFQNATSTTPGHASQSRSLHHTPSLTPMMRDNRCIPVVNYSSSDSDSEPQAATLAMPTPVMPRLDDGGGWGSGGMGFHGMVAY